MYYAGKVAEAFNTRVGGLKNSYKYSLFNQVENLKARLEGKLFALHLLRVGNKPQQELGRFLYMPESWSPAEKKWMDDTFTQFIVTGIPPPLQTDFILHVIPMPTTTTADQVSLLCSIPNWHWWDYVKLNSLTRDAQRPKVRYTSHLLFSPDEVEFEDGYVTKSHPPTSPRNRVMYLAKCKDDFFFLETLQKLTDVDEGIQSAVREEAVPPCHSAAAVGDQVQSPPSPPAPKRRRRHAGVKVLRVERKSLCEQLEVDLNSILNYQNPHRLLFSTFKEQLISDGLIQWRAHSESREVVVMSNYDSSTGEMQPCSYVHVSALAAETGDFLLSCTCATYDLIQRAAMQNHTLSPGEQGVLDPSSTCMHCRFYKELLTDFWQNIHSGAELSILHMKIKETLGSLQEEVVLLGDVLPHTTTKFSVQGEEDLCSVVTISFRRGQCYARCTEGICSAQSRNRKKIPKVYSCEDPGELCTHLQVLGKHYDSLHSLFPEFFNPEAEADETEEDTHPVAQDGPNMDDATVRNPTAGDFDVTTGLWNYPAYSVHQPKQMCNLDLIR